MSILTQKLNENKSASKSKVNYKPSEGWKEARIVALADVGEEPNKFQDGKMQAKFSVMFALDETLEFGDGVVSPKTHVEKFVASLYNKSNLVAKYLSPAGIEIESLDQLIGQTMKLKFKLSDCGKYTNVVNVDESETPLPQVQDVFVPKFYLVDSNGEPTNYDIIAEDGVIAELIPKSNDGEITDDSIYA